MSMSPHLDLSLYFRLRSRLADSGSQRFIALVAVGNEGIISSGFSIDTVHSEAIHCSLSMLSLMMFSILEEELHAIHIEAPSH